VNELRLLVDGRGLVESPRFHDGRVYFSDWTAGEVLAVDPDGTGLDVIARVRSLPLCTEFLPDGRLLIVNSTDGKLLTRGDDGTLTEYADLGRPGWNDIAVDAHGNAYVNRVDFNVMAGEDVKPGTVTLVTPAGAVREVADDIAFPNGMLVLGSTLVVADSYRHQLVAFDIGNDGTLSGRRIWADLGPGTPDGICAAPDHTIWYADVPNKWCRQVAEGGEVLQTVELDRGGFACTLDPAGTLFIVAAIWQGMTEPEPVKPGSGQLLAVQIG
jgi:sugar lactone lactonase YvrE